MDNWRSTIDWVHESKKLLDWTLSRCGDAFPQGVTAQDLVQAVIQKAYDGTRHYDPSLGKFSGWARDQIRSEVSNLKHKASFKDKTSGERIMAEMALEHGAEEQEESSGSDANRADLSLALQQVAAGAVRSVEAQVIDSETEKERKVFFERLRARCADDPQLVQLH